MATFKKSASVEEERVQWLDDKNELSCGTSGISTELLSFEFSTQKSKGRGAVSQLTKRHETWVG